MIRIWLEDADRLADRSPRDAGRSATVDGWPARLAGIAARVQGLRARPATAPLVHIADGATS